MKKRIINGLIACGFLFLAYALKWWIFPAFEYVSVIENLFYIPVIHFVMFALCPQKSLGIVQLTAIISIYVVLSNLSGNWPGNWQEILYKTIATILGGLILWLFKKILTAKSA